MATLTRGWATILRLLWSLLRRLLAWLEEILERARHSRRKPGHRDYRDACCIVLPPSIRARPDPYVYSQQWLRSRGLGVTWDNPDFHLRDVGTGAVVPRTGLQPNHDYDIEVTVHNNSFMAAIHTNVHFEVRGFGAGTALLSDLGNDVLTVLGASTATARRRWRTPASGGHNCLIATVSHPDDANPLNNVGQHNTDVATPASPTRKLAFQVRNSGRSRRTFHLQMDAYRLPEKKRCAENYGERQSIKYLRRLQQEHDPRKFPVPDHLKATLTAREITLNPDAAAEVTLELTPPKAGSPPQTVNVHVTEGDVLIGGVTALVLPEGGI